MMMLLYGFPYLYILAFLHAVAVAESVKYADGAQRCVSAPTVEAMSSFVKFRLGSNLQLSPHNFSLYIIREENQVIVLHCERIQPKSVINCAFPEPRHFRSEGIVGEEVVLAVSNATIDLEGIYTLHLDVNGVEQASLSCSLTVFTRIKHGSNDKSLSSSNIIIAAVISVLVALFAVIIGCGIFHTWNNKCRLNKERGDAQNVEFQKLDEPEEQNDNALN